MTVKRDKAYICTSGVAIGYPHNHCIGVTPRSLLSFAVNRKRADEAQRLNALKML